MSLDTDPLTILRLVYKGPCWERDDQPFWRLRTVKERGWVEPYDKPVMPHYGPSTKWQLSPAGRAELRRLEAKEATTANSVGTKAEGRSAPNPSDTPRIEGGDHER